MSDAGSKDKAVTPASYPLNKGEVMGDIGLYEVLAVVDIKAIDSECNSHTTYNVRQITSVFVTLSNKKTMGIR
jgi:hypothetical protein